MDWSLFWLIAVQALIGAVVLRVSLEIVFSGKFNPRKKRNTVAWRLEL